MSSGSGEDSFFWKFLSILAVILVLFWIGGVLAFVLVSNK